MFLKQALDLDFENNTDRACFILGRKHAILLRDVLVEKKGYSLVNNCSDSFLLEDPYIECSIDYLPLEKSFNYAEWSQEEKTSSKTYMLSTFTKGLYNALQQFIS